MPIDNELEPTCVQNCAVNRGNTIIDTTELSDPIYACPEGYKLLERNSTQPPNATHKLCIRTDGSDRPRP